MQNFKKVLLSYQQQNYLTPLSNKKANIKKLLILSYMQFIKDEREDSHKGKVDIQCSLSQKERKICRDKTFDAR